jgi:tetratricopeptide (TPR) repeat protein
MFKKTLLASIIFTLTTLSLSAQTTTGTPEYISPTGTKYYAQADEKNVVAEAEKNLAADPKNIDLLIALGRAQASVWRYRDAIATYTRGIAVDPKNAMLYRHRGHRYITLRMFDKAVKDLELAAKLNDRDYDIWYHLGLAYYLTGEFKKAAKAYERCRAVAAKDDSLIAVSDWLYMTYRRQEKEYEAAQVLERITLNMKVEENKSYYDRLLMYKRFKKESEIVTDKMTDLDIATVTYGVGNWHLCNGDKAKAMAMFQKITDGKYWPAFGFIAAETDLKRIRM